MSIAQKTAGQIVGWGLVILWVIGGLVTNTTPLLIAALVVALILVASYFVPAHEKPAAMG